MAHRIKNILRSVLKTGNSWKIDLLHNWPEIIGDLGSKVQLEKINGTTLVLSVADACWLQELYLLSPILLKAINEKLDHPRIKHLRFKQAGTKKVTRTQQAHTRKKQLKNVTLSQRERAALAKINDPQLSSALKRFLVRCYQEKEENS